MKVVLVQEVPGLGIPGDVKEVKGGYARNYLIPERLAVAATAAELARAASRRKVEMERRGRLNQEMATVARELEAEPLVIEARVGPGGRLYGSITAADIAQAVAARLGREVDRRTVELAQPLRELGEHRVRVRLAPDVMPTVRIAIRALGAQPGEAAATPGIEPEQDAEESQAPSA